MMCLADRYAVICPDAIGDARERAAVVQSLKATGKAIIEITLAQLHCFAGNMLQAIDSKGNLFLIMSSQAFYSLTAEQRAILAQYNPIIHSPLDHIEAAGGGSARCMMAEIFLEKNDALFP